jgi:hypothetical protein
MGAPAKRYVYCPTILVRTMSCIMTTANACPRIKLVSFPHWSLRVSSSFSVRGTLLLANCSLIVFETVLLVIRRFWYFLHAGYTKFSERTLIG